MLFVSHYVMGPFGFDIQVNSGCVLASLICHERRTTSILCDLVFSVFKKLFENINNGDLASFLIMLHNG